jgi:methenyltetrahydromethanopterin cyclohydrolase
MRRILYPVAAIWLIAVAALYAVGALSERATPLPEEETYEEVNRDTASLEISTLENSWELSR